MTNFYYCSFVKYYIKVSLNTGSELGWLWRLVQNSYQGISVYGFGKVIRVYPYTCLVQLSGWIRILVRNSYQGGSGYWFSSVIRVYLEIGSELFFWILIRDCYPCKSGDWFRTFIWVYLATGSERYVTWKKFLQDRRFRNQTNQTKIENSLHCLLRQVS